MLSINWSGVFPWYLVAACKKSRIEPHVESSHRTFTPIRWLDICVSGVAMFGMIHIYLRVLNHLMVRRDGSIYSVILEFFVFSIYPWSDKIDATAAISTSGHSSRSDRIAISCLTVVGDILVWPKHHD
jgi:hypothetical protein